MTRPGNIQASKIIAPQPSFTAYLFSNPWPYAISPLQAYILGVVGCLSTFILYIFVSHTIYKMRRKRLRKRSTRRATKNRTVEMGRATSYDVMVVKDNTKDAVNHVFDPLPSPAQTDQGECIGAKCPHSKNDDVKESNHFVTKANIVSHKLYEHMNSFPLDNIPRSSHGIKAECPVVETDEAKSIKVRGEESSSSKKLNTLNSIWDENKLDYESSQEERVHSDTTIIDESSIKNSLGDKLTQITNNDALAEKRNASMPLDSSTTPSTLSSHNATKDAEEAISYNDTKDYGCDIKDDDKENDCAAPNEVMSTDTLVIVDEMKGHNDKKSGSAHERSTSKNTKTCNANEVLKIDSHFIVVLSDKISIDTQGANQREALELLDDLQLPYQVVDAQKETKSNDIFKLNEVRGAYPQIFVCEKGQHRYLGSYDWLKQSIADISVTEQGTALLTALGRKKESPDSDLSSGTNQFKGHIVVLVSNGVADYLQKANQKSALQFLTDLNIPHTIVDGMDALQKEERNRLFKISGIRGNYPQLFAAGQGSGELFYLGGYNWLESQDLTSLAAVIG